MRAHDRLRMTQALAKNQALSMDMRVLMKKQVAICIYTVQPDVIFLCSIGFGLRNSYIMLVTCSEHAASP